jgi:hypothetical protein
MALYEIGRECGLGGSGVGKGDMACLHTVLVVKGPAADASDAPQPCGLLCNPMMKMMIIFYPFPSNGAPVE